MKPPPFALRIVVFDAHADDGTDTGEAVHHHPDQRAIAEPDDVVDVDQVNEGARLLDAQHRCAAAFDDVLRSAERLAGSPLALTIALGDLEDGGELVYRAAREAVVAQIGGARPMSGVRH